MDYLLVTYGIMGTSWEWCNVEDKEGLCQLPGRAELCCLLVWRSVDALLYKHSYLQRWVVRKNNSVMPHLNTHWVLVTIRIKRLLTAVMMMTVMVMVVACTCNHSLRMWE